MSACSTSSLALTLAPLEPWLTSPDVHEICINRPGELFVESVQGWQRESIAFADFDWCRRLAKLIANATSQRVDEAAPLLSAWLPGGQRVQVVLPPATVPGHVAIAIRRPAAKAWTVAELGDRGAFRTTQRSGAMADQHAAHLQALLAAGDYSDFVRAAVRCRKNILVSGPTGSGKTTWTKALIREIPHTERLITIEDAQELVLDSHPNSVRLFYSKDDQGLARVTPRQLLDCCLRMRPDRILLAELRSAEAFDYLRSVNSGHPGSITSIHAGSAAMALEQLVLLVKQSDGGRELSRGEIRRLLRTLIDVIIQFSVDNGQRVISEIWYEGDLRGRSRR